MKLKNKKTQVYLMIILIVAILIGIGYAALSATLNINGQTTINKASWDIHMEDINVTSGSVTATTAPTLDTSKTTVNFSVKLTNPGDYYEFTVDEVNAGTIDGMISSIVKTGLTESQAKYLDYTVTYTSGVEIAERQLLSANKTEKIIVRVAFKKDLTASDLPTTDTTLNLSFSINYIQADESAVAVAHPICKRATVLHTETCNRIGTYGCKSNSATSSTVTYGNLGTKGTLTSGDAFDCDVNGDGTFDPTTERFYYVSDKDADSSSDYATLIYYNNVSGGVPNNTATFAYNINYSGSNDTIYRGPETAMLQLPTTSKWSNVSLSDTTRDILDETGIVKLAKFSYSGYAARLLTVQEINSACGITVGSYNVGELDICKYLMENTNYTNSSLTYGYWLESVRSSDASSAWNVYDYHRYVDNDTASNSNYYGVRPAIEVLKSKISS